MNFLIGYLEIGIGFYVGMSVKNHKSFTNASAAGLIRGLLLGIPFWPIGLIVVITQIMMDPKP